MKQVPVSEVLCPFPEEIITKTWKYIGKINKSSSPEPPHQFQLNLAQSILG